MSKFEVRIREVAEVGNHPDADRLSINRVDGFQVISNKHEDGSHRYSVGDLVVYLPEASIVPENLLRPGYWDEKKSKGILRGKNGDRVGPIRLRGVVSEGLIFPLRIDGMSGGLFVNDIPLGLDLQADVAEKLGVTKWEPEIPASMSGEVDNTGVSINFDLENLKKFPDLFEDGEMVLLTEKLHGTNAQVIFDIPNREYHVTSKGLGAKGLTFKMTEENLRSNLYLRTIAPLLDTETIFNHFLNARFVRLFGEVFGPGVQDLAYGREKPEFRVFDLKVDQVWVDQEDLHNTPLLDNLGLVGVPVLHQGPFSQAMIEETKGGESSLSPGQIREGVVVRPLRERQDPRVGRVVAKAVSDEYLSRKGGTEFQ